MSIAKKISSLITKRYGATERYGSPDKLYVFKRIYHYVITRYGSIEAKQKIWDSEFREGKWDSLVDTEDDKIYAYLNKYCAGGSLLDLGCGYGATFFHGPHRFRSYMGVDVSPYAIARCVESCKNNQIDTGHAKFHVSDIVYYTPETVYDCILFRESLYYLPKNKIAWVLQKYSKFLMSKGVIVVRICDITRFASIRQHIFDSYDVLDSSESGKMSIIVFQPFDAL